MLNRIPYVTNKSLVWYSKITMNHRSVPALGVGHEVRRPRAQAKEGPKPRYTNSQVL